MDIARTQIPHLPPDWTVGRCAKYAAKLAAFIVVPGLHQFTRNRRILGGILMICYFGVEFVMSNNPWEGKVDPLRMFIHNNDLYFFSNHASEIFQYFAWFLLALDYKNLGTRTLRINLFVVLACAAGVYFVPDHKPLLMYVYVEQQNYVCPPFCKYDIIEYEPVYGDFEMLSEGVYVAIRKYGQPRYSSKLLAGPMKDYLIVTIEEACAGFGDADELQRIEKEICESELKRYRRDFLTLGGIKSKHATKDGQKISLTSILDIEGVVLRRIGNTHEYFVISDEFTDHLGNALLVFYKWTGFNPFGLTKTPKP